MKKCNHLKLIIDNFFKVIDFDNNFITDYYKHNQSNSFKDNRHDQSILSLLRKKYDSIVLSDETYITGFQCQNNCGICKLCIRKFNINYPFWATRKK